MGKIVVSENVTLDGVIQDPAGDEGFRADGWVGLIGDSPQLAKLALDEMLAAGALLLGRRRRAPRSIGSICKPILRHWPWNRHPHPANMAG